MHECDKLTCPQAIARLCLRASVRSQPGVFFSWGSFKNKHGVRSHFLLTGILSRSFLEHRAWTLQLFASNQLRELRLGGRSVPPKARLRSTIVIPARLASTRLPRKLLLRETGKPLIQHTYEVGRRAADHWHRRGQPTATKS